MDVPVAPLDELFNTFLAVQARITANLEAHAATLGLNSRLPRPFIATTREGDRTDVGASIPSAMCRQRS